ncbi:MAG: isoprenylcysteine carboxylmethyltransferase family protein [Deltaproteobacteria bacterium]|uniref:Isoprenylcysteine carboxylmethyltransferase family protein n=1 Tax=Candidatus Zymogenus saltonus TaxID=2844893 RepID=A0A9D8PP78_9DELT|nr:isoprenylcysteine carboxylmethyltransferase family protein [Candidatus Zymogenus saltonus]
MDLIPELRLGLVNGWWFSSAYLLINGAVMALIPREAARRLTTHPSKNLFEKIFLTIQMILFFGTIVFAIFVPVKPGTVWFWSGLSVFVIGMAAYVVSMFNFAKAPMDKPALNGLYRISRNPIHVFSFVAWIGIGIAAASWIILSATVIVQIMMHKTTLEEERFCLEAYGDSYRKYMKEVPRYLLFF